ncbi:neuropeptide-like 1 isoform X1 [Centruroides vittatus]|uniref:neuropeptide-like 1 isoform X1 n=2 Tax=Centruroides vittatus TaxID=120091 RepID=UPI0035108539
MSKLHLLCVVFILVFQFEVFKCLAMEDYAVDPNWQNDFPDYLVEKDKRHLASMAKNGRLPSAHFNGKRSDSDNDSTGNIDQTELISGDKQNESELKPPELITEQKRHIGAFLKSRGHPLSAFHSMTRGWDLENEDNPGKRNIAALARMGRLQAKSWPYGLNREDDDKDSECMEEKTNSIREKRYIAALARKGRLPPLRGFRPQWFSDKRTKNQEMYLWSPYRSAKSSTDKRIQKDVGKTKKCKKNIEEIITPEEENLLGLDLSGLQKKNVALLARKGLLSSRPFVPRDV